MRAPRALRALLTGHGGGNGAWLHQASSNGSGIDDFLKTNPEAYDAITAARKQASLGFKDTDLATALMNAKMRAAGSTGTIGGPGYEGRIRGALEKLREGPALP